MLSGDHGSGECIYLYLRNALTHRATRIAASYSVAFPPLLNTSVNYLEPISFWLRNYARVYLQGLQA